MHTTHHPGFALCILALSLTTATPHCAADNRIEVTKHLNYRQPVTPEVLDNYLFSTFHASGKKAYNLKGFEIAKTSGRIVSIKISPAGATYALITDDGPANTLRIYNTYKAGEPVGDMGRALNPTAIAYSADSRWLYAADRSGQMHRYDARTLALTDRWPLDGTVTEMKVSANDHHIAAIAGDRVIIINPEGKSIRATLPFPSQVADVCFSPDASLLGIALRGGEIHLLNTRDFTPARTPIDIPGASALTIHPDNKYVAVARGGDTVQVINITDGESASIAEPTGHTDYVRFLRDGKDNTYLTFNATGAVKYKLIGGLVPNYSKMLREEVIARMEEWSKMAPDETEAQYMARVNEETRLVQARLFEEEIATRMADDMILRSTVTLGAYNPNDNTLSIGFDNMPPIYLTVPEQEVADFMNPGNLEFRNPIYGITPDDRFELIYAEVYNRQTGKTYEFNNRERKSLDYLMASSDFVPIELVRQSGMEEVKLSGIRNSIVEQAMRDNLISNHTDIDVSTSIIPSADADGRPITNYRVGFRYTVKGGWSAREDFAPGKYELSGSNAAMSMLRIVDKAFATDFARYIRPGRKVIVTITGSADALPITGRIAYDGQYGEFTDEPVTLGSDLSTITLTRASGIRTNEQLAFARAAAVDHYLTGHLTQLASMTTDRRYRVELSDKKGGEYRRISVDFTFIDAF